MYGIWNFSLDDWCRCASCHAILAYETKQKACKAAAKEWGYDTYTKAKKDGWCEVRPLTQ